MFLFFYGYSTVHLVEMLNSIVFLVKLADFFVGFQKNSVPVIEQFFF